MEENILKERLEEIQQRLLSIQLLEEDLKYITNQKMPYFHEVVSKSHLFYRVKENILRRIVLELCMLLNRDEDSNFLSFVDNLAIHYKKSTWHSRIKLSEIQEIQSELQDLIVSDEFRKLLLLRNKFYAHIDKRRREHQFELKFIEVWALFSQLKFFHDELNSKLFNTRTFWSFNKTNMGHYILENLYKYDVIRDLVWEEEKKNPVKNKYAEVLKIMRTDFIPIEG